MLKIANAAEDPVVTDFQIRALEHLAVRDPSLAVPRVVPTRDGRTGFALRREGRAHRVRLVTFLPGRPLADTAPDASTSADLGVFLARLDRALADFTHPGDAQPLLWDMQRAAELEQLLGHVADTDVRRLLGATLDEFAAEAAPRFADLRRQVIHNDANPGNVLVADDGRVAGVIDFGDMLRAPAIVEPAVAASYLRALDGDPLRHVAALVAGYHSITPLAVAELDVLHTLIKTRLATTVLVLAWRESLRDADDSYLRDTAAAESTAFGFLERLAALSQAEARDRYAQACAAGNV